MKILFYKLIDLLNSIVFNFHYLPFKQAVKLPIKVCGLITYDFRGGKN